MTTLIRGTGIRPRWKSVTSSGGEASRGTARRRARTAGGTAAEKAYGLSGWEPAALIVVVLLALFCGLVELYSASALMAQADGLPAHYYALRQLVGVVIGVVFAAIIGRIDYRLIQPVAWPLMIATLTVLVLMILPGTESIAPRVNGARRWIQLGITFQPSEFAKISIIVWTAALAVKKQDRLHSLRKGLLPFLLVWLAVAVPVLMQPNFSAALLLLLLAALVLFAGGARIGHIILLGMFAVPVAWSQIENAGYRMRRIVAFLDPSADPSGVTYQIHQALIAVGSGGIAGVGLGGSRQKFGFLPEPHNDFLFAMVGEEWGLIGVCVILALFLAFAVIGYRISRAAPDLFGYLLGLGVTNLIVVSALLHMGVSLALLPTTGVNLPFMSYGRSGLLVAFIAVGLLLSVARSSLATGETRR